MTKTEFSFEKDSKAYCIYESCNAALQKMERRQANEIQLMIGQLMTLLNITYEEAIVTMYHISRAVIRADCR